MELHLLIQRWHDVLETIPLSLQTDLSSVSNQGKSHCKKGQISLRTADAYSRAKAIFNFTAASHSRCSLTSIDLCSVSTSTLCPLNCTFPVLIPPNAILLVTPVKLLSKLCSEHRELIQKILTCFCPRFWDEGKLFLG